MKKEKGPPAKGMRKKRLLLLRQRNRCTYCGKALNRKTATLDHVVPKSKGGKSGWKNLVLACAECNRRKGNKSPMQ